MNKYVLLGLFAFAAFFVLASLAVGGIEYAASILVGICLAAFLAVVNRGKRPK